MGYYFDYIDKRWLPKRQRSITAQQRRDLIRRKGLVAEVVEEIECGDDRVARLYAVMLARALVKTDESLMTEFGKRLAAVAGQSGPKSHFANG